MATFNPRKFSNPDWLQSIEPRLLGAFLGRWQAYLEHRGLCLSGALDYERTASILLSPTPEVPLEMVDALYYVHETCSHDDLDALIAAAKRDGLELDQRPDASAADLAIEVWLKRPALLQQRHAEVLARRQRSFNYFAGKQIDGRPFPDLSQAQLTQIQDGLDDWFAEHRRGRGSRVFLFRDPGRVWIVVRHGMPMRREASHADDGNASTAFYRPQQHDVLIHDEGTDEMGVAAGTLGERRSYLRVLGRVVFDDEGYFPDAKKFTLDPLIERGADALACDDLDGIERVTLIEYRREWGGRHKELETRRATDVFATLQSRGWPTRLQGRIIAATFHVKFIDAPKERRVVLRPPATALYDRDDDCVRIEQWLRARGFMRTPAPTENDDEEAPEVLEGAR